MSMQEIKIGNASCFHKDGTIFMKTKKSLFYLDKCRVCGTEIVVRVDQERICSECDEREKGRSSDDRNAMMDSRDENLLKIERRRERLREWRRRKREECAGEECAEKKYQPYKNGEIRKCEICGKLYKARAKQQKFCSATCKQRSHELAEGEKYVPLPQKIECRFCGKSFSPISRTNNFCSRECSKKFYLHKQKERRRMQREKKLGES